MKKLPAFTLIEMLITMLISIIVVGACYKSYQIVTKQFGDYKKINEKTVEAMLINALIENDFMEADSITKDNATVLFFKNDKVINYNFHPDYILREQIAMQDTFFIKPENTRLTFRGKGTDDDKSIIDELYFESSILDEYEQFSYKKIYGSDVLIKHN